MSSSESNNPSKMASNESLTSSSASARMIPNQTLPANKPPASHHDRAVLQRLMRDIKLRLKENIPDTGFQYKPYVFSESDFQMKMAAYLALNDREVAIDNIDDFPTDPEAQRRIVQDIVEAMMNTDKETLIDPQAKLPITRIKRLSPIELDLMAWKVLVETRDVQRGTVSIPSWGKDWIWKDFPSFSDRLEAVRKALFHCKAMVSSLFDDIFTKRLSLNPTAEFLRKNNNTKVNGKRKQILELARATNNDGVAPSSIPQTPNEPTSSPSTSRLSSGPGRTRTQTQSVSSMSVKSIFKKRKTNNWEADTGFDLFDIQQNTEFLASGFEQPSFDQDFVTGDFDFSRVTDEIGSSTNDSEFSQGYKTRTGSMLETPFGSHTEQERTVDGLGERTFTEEDLLANDFPQWADSGTASSSNQQAQQPINNSTHPTICKRKRANPASSSTWAGQPYLPSRDDNRVCQGGQKRSSGGTTVQNFTDKVQPSNAFSLDETLPAESTPHETHRTGRRDQSNPTHQHPELPQDLQEGHQAVYGYSPGASIADLPVSNQELDDVLNMPSYFDPELGVWKDDSGETVEFPIFSSFQSNAMS